METAQVDAADAAPRVSVPTFVLINGRDDAVPVSHPHQVFEAIGHNDKELVELPEANHYFAGDDQASHLGTAADLVHSWLTQHQLGGPG